MPATSEESRVERLTRLWGRLENSETAVVRETWPESKALSLLQALEETAPERARELHLAYRFLGGLLRVPIVVVAGLLNAGKSSLIASFLSDDGRRRVLRGVGRAAGTHRFTLWCPAAWEADPSFRAALEAILLEVFGEAPELLSIDPEVSSAQQNERRRLSAPLLAFDAGLDVHRVSLLDCPDIQRSDAPEVEGGRTRREMLMAAARLCSAVFLVLPRSQMEVVQVADVIEALPDAVRVLVVNLCSVDEPPRDVVAEARAMWGEAAAFFYLAYDFRHRGYETVTPAWDPNLRSDRPPGPAAVPCFFSVTEKDAMADASRVARDADLLVFAEKLPPERLLQQRQRSLLREFGRQISEAGRIVARAVQGQNDALVQAGDSLQTELSGLWQRDGELRVKLDPRLLEDFALSIRRTAPWDLKPFLWMSQKAGSAIRAIRSLAKGVREGVGARIVEEGRRVAATLSDARIDADRIADRLRYWGISRGYVRDHSTWMPVAERILERFQQQEYDRLPRDEWDERARDLWREVPVWRARAVVLTTVMVTTAAVALLSVAGGPVLVAMGLKSAALTVTAKELLVVVGLGSMAQGEAARRLDEWLRERVGVQQRTRFFTAAFDELGLPPDLLTGPRLPGKPSRRAMTETFISRELKARRRSWDSTSWERIGDDLEQLMASSALKTTP